MSERRPDPADPRASLVDSGWSEPAPAPERELPSYEDAAREHLVTRVDDQIQSRIAAMNLEDRADVPTSPPVAVPPLPPPPLPPPPRRPSAPPPPRSAPRAPVPELHAAPIDELTLVDSRAPGAVEYLPSSAPPLPPPSLPPPSMPPPRALSAPPPLPSASFAPMHAGQVAPFVPPPSLGEALLDRVRVAGGEVPLWGVLAPLLGLTGLFAALLAGALGPSGAEPARGSAASAASNASNAVAAAPAVGPTSETDTASAPRAGSVVEQARAGDEKALSVLAHQKPEERGAEEALALASGRVAQSVATAVKLRTRLAADPGLAKDPKVIADLRRLSQEPDTSRDALAAMAALPGSLSADLLYEAWTSTAERSDTTELAQALLVSRDVRPKASPALAVALDLREAETCEANAKLLTRAVDVGDKRAFAPLSRLLRRNGCGPTKRDDCYACIRDGDLLKKALTTVKLRREPELVRRDTPPH